MNPQPPAQPQQRPTVDAPAIEQEDWEGLERAELDPDGVPGNGDLRYDEEDAEEPAEEDDDNPYQESDEALPDDDEEAAISRRLGAGPDEPE